jgi:hypothetical protein
MVKDLRVSFLQRHCRAGLGIFFAGLLAYPVAAFADEVTSKGTLLHGKITAVSAAGITFSPEYGKGSLEIKWESVEGLKTDGAFQILYGEDQESSAPLQGFSNGKLLAGAAGATATPIDVTTIQSGWPLGGAGPSLSDRMHSYWRYWSGNFDLGLSVQQATTDTTGFVLGLKTERAKAPTRLTLGASYRYATQKQSGESLGASSNKSTTTQDQAMGSVREEYDFTPRIYGFASGDATYDAIQKLSIRGVPKAGPGYVLWEEKLDAERRNFLQVEAGGSWVYEKYFQSTNTPENNYFAIAFGALAGYYLPYGAHFDWKVDYLPAVDDFTGKYLLRSDAGLSIPVVAALAAKFSLLDEYNSKPAAEAKRNSLYLTAGVSLVW